MDDGIGERKQERPDERVIQYKDRGEKQIKQRKNRDPDVVV